MDSNSSERRFYAALFVIALLVVGFIGIFAYRAIQSQKAKELSPEASARANQLAEEFHEGKGLLCYFDTGSITPNPGNGEYIVVSDNRVVYTSSDWEIFPGATMGNYDTGEKGIPVYFIDIGDTEVQYTDTVYYREFDNEGKTTFWKCCGRLHSTEEVKPTTPFPYEAGVQEYKNTENT